MNPVRLYYHGATRMAEVGNSISMVKLINCVRVLGVTFRVTGN